MHAAVWPYSPDLRQFGLKSGYVRFWSVTPPTILFFCLFLSISLTADGPQRARSPIPLTATLPSCLWTRRMFPSLPGSRLMNFTAMQVQPSYNSSINHNGSILLTRVLTLSATDARIQNKLWFSQESNLTTSALVSVRVYLLDHSGDECL